MMLPPSQVYLLRIWPSVQNGRVNWRFRLENPRTGDYWHFASQHALQQFITNQLEPDSGQVSEFDEKRI